MPINKVTKINMAMTIENILLLILNQNIFPLFHNVQNLLMKYYVNEITTQR